MKRISPILTAILLFAYSGISFIQADNLDIKDIVLINSYHPAFEWTKEITESIIRELPEKENYRISIENMDAKRFNKKNHLESFRTYLETKYAALKIDGIICSDNHAFEFVLEHGSTIWGDVPIAFCGVNNIENYSGFDTLRIKGVDEALDMAGTIHLIQKIEPQLKNLIVISDSTLTGRLFMDQFKIVAKNHFPHLIYTPIYAVSSEMLEKTLSSFSPKNNAIYLLSLYVERSGISRSITLESEILKNSLDVPIYTNWFFMLNHGVLGGVLQKGEEQGAEAARIMRKMLNGESSSIPYLTHSNTFTVIDYKELTRQFPGKTFFIPEATYINKPMSFVEKNKTSLLIFSSLISVFLLIIILLARIISIKRAAEKQIRKGEDRLELALEGANIGLWDINFRDKESYFNEKTASLLGYDKACDFTFDYNNWSELMHPEDVEPSKDSFLLHLAGFTNNFKGEIRFKMASGDYRWFSVLGIITEMQNKKATRVLGVIMDIHNQKIFEKQLKSALAKAEESDRLKSSFLANMSHEIRTPMNAILGFSEILIQQPVGADETITYLKMIRSSGDSLLNLINDIIDISKMESGKFKLSPTHFDLHALLDRINLMVQTDIKKQKQNNIEFILKKGVQKKEYFIFTDRFRLEQVLNNLITNALKFTKNGMIELSYKILDEENIAFTVADTGIGIAPEDQMVIFDRFRQIDNNNYESKGGIGLGLSITKNIIQLMKGEIEVSSEISKGSKFTVTIPCILKE